MNFIEIIGARLTIDETDIAEFSCCVKTECRRRSNCRRYLLYEYLLKENISGHTCIVPQDAEKCDSHIPDVQERTIPD